MLIRLLRIFKKFIPDFLGQSTTRQKSTAIWAGLAVLSQVTVGFPALSLPICCHHFEGIFWQKWSSKSYSSFSLKSLVGIPKKRKYGFWQNFQSKTYVKVMVTTWLLYIFASSSSSRYSHLSNKWPFTNYVCIFWNFLTTYAPSLHFLCSKLHVFLAT